MRATLKELEQVAPRILLTWVSITITTSLISYLGELHSLLELLSHGRIQLLCTSALLLLLTMLLRQKLSAVLAVFSLLINAYPVVPYFLSPAPTVSMHGDSYKAISLNVLTKNKNYVGVANYLSRQNADFILLTEVDSGWCDYLNSRGDLPEHRRFVPRSDNFGIALFSKYRIEDERISKLPRANVPVLDVDIQLDNQGLRLIGAHTLPPMGTENARIRNEGLEYLGKLVQQKDSPTLLIGDLNISPWSPFFSAMLAASGLHDSSLGLGIHPSWPTGSWIFRTAIDHILLSDQLATTSKSVGPNLGSDHFPVIVEFAWRE